MESTVQEVKELGERVVQMVDRLTLLEKDCAYITETTEAHSENFGAKKIDTIEELNATNETIAFVKEKIKNVRIELDILIGKLQDTVRTQDLESIKERVENWAPESFATKLDLKEYTDY